MFDKFEADDAGRPTPAHKWEEKFFRKGHGINVPIEDLQKRIAQLEKAITDSIGKDVDAEKLGVKQWFRELAWRRKQLTRRLGGDGKEADNGDVEPAV